MFSSISDTAKFVCVAAGLIAAVLVASGFRMLAPQTVYVDLPQSYPSFDPAQRSERRQQTAAHILTWLKDDPASLCSGENRHYFTVDVQGYFKQRAEDRSIAEHYLAPVEAAVNDRAWDEGDPAKAMDAIVGFAKEGLITRADFDPIFPDLATLLDQTAPVKSICKT